MGIQFWTKKWRCSTRRGGLRNILWRSLRVSSRNGILKDDDELEDDSEQGDEPEQRKKKKPVVRSNKNNNGKRM
jgi:hypothetical protein